MTARSTKGPKSSRTSPVRASSASTTISNSQSKATAPGGVVKRPRGRPPKSQKALDNSIARLVETKPVESPKVDSKVEPPAATAIEAAPMTPVSPIESDSDKANEPETSIPEISQEELELYLKEYAAVSSGTDSDSMGDSSAPLSPVLDIDNESSFGSAPSSSIPELDTPTIPTLNNNINLNSCGEEFAQTYMDIPEQNTEPKLDDYLNFINDIDTEPTPVPTEISQKRPAPFCIYRKPADSHYISSSFNPNNRTLIAAFNTMAPDVQYSSREAYLQSVLLAAASLTQRSLMTGRARETMAPALGTSY